eukprot:SAG31_NODE_34926_length_328_cov_0.454148_1_plen_20_part_01
MLHAPHLGWLAAAIGRSSLG